GPMRRHIAAGAQAVEPELLERDVLLLAGAQHARLPVPGKVLRQPLAQGEAEVLEVLQVVAHDPIAARSALTCDGVARRLVRIASMCSISDRVSVFSAGLSRRGPAGRGA